MGVETWVTVVDVQTAAVGAYLTADEASGSTLLDVSDVETFDEIGGQVEVNGVQYVYTGIDLAASTMTLFSGLTSAASEGDRVDISPPQSIKRALVDLGKDEDEGIWANVPQNLVNSLPDGERISAESEVVLIEERGLGEL